MARRSQSVQLGLGGAAPDLACRSLLTTTPPITGVPSPPLLPDRTPNYHTGFGAAYVGDARDYLTGLRDSSTNLALTSPPDALHFQKEYGNVAKDAYVAWFRPFAKEIHRALAPDGSFVLNIGGSYNQGSPTRSLYHFKLLIMLCEEVGFHLAQECFWYNPAKLPSPAEWVNVRRQRIRDSVEYVWWLSKTPWPKADNAQVLVEYGNDMKRLITRGVKPKRRPSGHVITAKFGQDRGGAIPSNPYAGTTRAIPSTFGPARRQATGLTRPAFLEPYQSSLSSCSPPLATLWSTPSPAVT